jgi:hypothetical protein
MPNNRLTSFSHEQLPVEWFENWVEELENA